MDELLVGPEDAGSRLDVYVGSRLESRTAAQQLIEAGGVTVDGEARPKRYVLQGGERLVIERLASPEPEAVPTARFTVTYEDDEVLVIDKPAGVVVHPSRGHRSGTLAQALAGRITGGSDPERAGIVHRLDQDTSGLLVVARTEAAHTALQAQLRERRIAREYLTLVEGRPSARTGTIDAPLGRDRRVRTRISTDTDDPRAARTHFAIERALNATTLLRVTLETGRTHQIRAHLDAIGHQVCGDPVYGTPGRFGLERQFLHATRLVFAHPTTGVEVEAVSPLPGDLRTALESAADE
ncbi:MAG: RluA family pseudouridine synthase [Solirubrobacterales bacterium]|nr:RluA family pseudouridine synthase [Solirubrobacterales bacterium]